MNDQQHRFLTLMAVPPARLTYEHIAWILNCHPDDIRVLITKKLLKPLGQPPANGVKFIAAEEIRALAKDPAWLARVTNAIHEHWRTKNQRRKSRGENLGLQKRP